MNLIFDFILGVTLWFMFRVLIYEFILSITFEFNLVI